ncbi:MAG TPA: ATP-binding protein, partial [Saprospiraceae bacterium]|nr:ATP-binding protein [Saprospiraceae bacterium]
ENIGKVNVIPQDLGRVILNLITNAFYAVSEKAKMTSRTPSPLTGGADYEPTISIQTKLLIPLSGGRGLEGTMVTISVSDNGPGIPKSALDKIFQPFFTTKPTGQGTGLGLSLSYDIVKAHGGELKVETKEGEGTVFTIHLPIS